MDDVKVLVVSSKYPPEYSGSGQRAHTTYQRLKAKYGISFDVLCGSVAENRGRRYIYEGVNVERIAAKPIPRPSGQKWDERTWVDKVALRVNYASEACRTWDFLKKYSHRYGLIHVFGNNAVTSAAITFCNRRRKPLIVEITYDERPQQYKPAVVRSFFDNERNGFHPQAQFVCISPKLEALCREEGIGQRIWTRPNPVDPRLFVTERGRKIECRARHSPFKKEDVVLVNVGKFMPLKNQDFLVDMMRFLPGNFKLALGGPVVSEGPNAGRDKMYLDLVRGKVRDYGLSDRVFIREGFITEPDEWMKMADVYVLPSKAEGLGTPMLESLCCGVPVVAHRIPGVTDSWVVEGKNGFLCELDPREFAQRIEQAVGLDTAALDRLADALRGQASVDVIDEEYERMITNLVKSRIRPSAVII